jgi:hypothetical protein
MLAPVIFTASAVLRLPLMVIAIMGLVLASAFSVGGRGNALAEFLSIATLGLAVGASGLKRIQPLLSRPLVLAFAYVVYLAAVNAWNVVFPLQVAGVCLTLMLIYLVGIRFGGGGAFPRGQLVELGRYTLLGYIVQILVLQVLRIGLASFDLRGRLSFIPFVVTVVGTWAAVRLTDRARQLCPLVDRAYRFVFG